MCRIEVQNGVKYKRGGKFSEYVKAINEHAKARSRGH